ncbi:MAG: biopolymer transporter ExbD [Opitutales bacterium]|jgi:biopolymer transport protein ExbD
MARTFHRRERLSALSTIDMSPLIDLAFSLLIVFMISTPLLEQTIKVDLPVESTKPQAAPDEQKMESIGIRADGRIFWGERQVDAGQLQGLLASAAAREEPPVISLSADRSLQYQAVIDVIDMIQKAGLHKLNINTQAGGK